MTFDLVCSAILLVGLAAYLLIGSFIDAHRAQPHNRARSSFPRALPKDQYDWDRERWVK